MKKIVYSISSSGAPGEYPEWPRKATQLDYVKYDIENLSRCCMQLRQDVADLQAELAELRKKP